MKPNRTQTNFMEETNMKKIIATVLAMVMALALCTVAFAATTTVTEVTGTDYETRSRMAILPTASLLPLTIS